MSQVHVEQIIGRLVTDDHWRARYRLTPDAALAALAGDEGLDLTTTERRALLALPGAVLDALAARLDPRLQRLGAPR